MMAVLNFALLLVGVIICIPSIILFVETVAAFWGSGASQPVIKGKLGNIAVLVPAHNESSGIASTLDDISRQLGDNDRLIVIADNCTDDTAPVAAAHGAQVIVRDDLTRRGKGFALAFGLDFLAARKPDIVIFIDADCHAGPDTIRTLALTCATSNRPVQALNLMKAPVGQEPRFAVAEFAWIIRNQVRPSGLANLGLPCQLMGTGMAFPWAVIRSANLASGNLVEDLELGINLARNGHPPEFRSDALVESRFPVTEEGMVKQRQRWEQGSLSMLLNSSVRASFEAIKHRNIPLLALALDMMVPPLAVHAAIIMLAIVIFGFFFLLGASGLPFVIAMISGSLFVTSVLLSWAGFGRTALPARQLQSLFPYLLAKLKIHRSFSARGRREWVRSDRTKEE